jgi:signal transduction histidine kinase
MWSKTWWRSCLAAAVMAAASPMAAQAQAGIAIDVPLNQLQRNHWGRAEGAPSRVTAVAQTPDGFIWVAGVGGLSRFDGVSFDRVALRSAAPLPGGAVLIMEATADGGLWVAYPSGAVLKVRGLEVTRMPPLPASAGNVRHLAVDALGRPWVTVATGIYHHTGEAWQPVSSDTGLGGSSFDDIFFDAAGSLWVLTDAGIFMRRKPSSRFEQMHARQAPALMTGMLPAAGGGVWLWTSTGEENLCRIRPGAPKNCWRAPGLLRPKVDARGTLWWAGTGALARLVQPDTLDPEDPTDLGRRLDRLEGMATDVIVARDGSIWAATRDGLMQLQESPIRRARTPSGAVVAGDGGELYVASFSRGLMRIGPVPPGTPLWEARDQTLWTAEAVAQSAGLADGTAFTPFNGPHRPDEPVVLQRYPEAGSTSVRLDRDRTGAVYFAALTPPRLLRVSDGRLDTVDLPALQRGAVIRGAGTDSKGALWFAASRTPVGFYRLADGRWQPHGGVAVPDPPTVQNMQLDAQDRMWLTLGDDSVGVVEAGRWRRYGAANGLAIGQALNVYSAGVQVWVSGDRGVAALANGRFHTLAGVNQQAFLGCSGIHQVANGDLWLNCVEATFRIVRAEWQRAMATPSHRVVFTRFDHLDGLRSGAIQGAPMPTLAEGTDGRLWFANSDGLYWLHPAALPPARPAPLVTLRSLQADAQAHAATPGLELPAGTQRVQFSYLAAGAEVPPRTRFRYRLLGVDDDWVEAGTRREVGYSRLSPGAHRFEVVAADRDGRWGVQPAVLEFRLRPAFHQTTLFYALAALCLLGLLATAYVLRLRQVSARIRAEMDARLNERTRIARELHDTLLQSVHGLMLHFQTVADRLPAGDPLRARAEAALARAETTINEGRDRVVALRETSPSSTSLGAQLLHDAQELARHGDTRIQLRQPLPPRPLHPSVQEQLLEIGREALRNALHHAQAREVALSLVYAQDAFSLSVSDDGVGFPPEVLAEGGRAGHWGLRGLKERAELIGADMTLRPGEDGGAAVHIHLPAALAYAEGAMAAAPAGGMVQRWAHRLTRALSGSP